MSQLIPSFSLAEPNISSAVKKNNEGVCAINNCTNKLNTTNPSYGFLGLKICLECRKIYDKMCQDIVNETTVELFRGIV